MAISPRRGVLVALVLAAVLGAAVATAGPDDRGSAEAALRDLEASPKKNVASEMTARARAALDRAAKLRASGDESHARLADALARTWAEAARDAVRAAELEEKAFAARRDASDAGARADRERALLEEAIAQSGRLRAQLEGLERESKEQPARTSIAGADAGPTRTAPKSAAPAPSAPAGKDGGTR
jgi:hypothetical protein